MNIVLEEVSGRSTVFIISKCQSSLSNKCSDRNQTWQSEAISNIVRIGWPDWVALHQFFIVISGACFFNKVNVGSKLG